MTDWMGYHFATTSFSESDRNNAAWDEARTEKRYSDRPAENNRPYTAEGASHTVASRETVLTASIQTGSESRLLLGCGSLVEISEHSCSEAQTAPAGETVLSPLKIKKGLMLWTKPRTKIYLSMCEKTIIEQNAKSAGFPYQSISSSVFWDICQETSCPKYSSVLITSWTNSASLSKAKSQSIRKKK